MSNDIICIATKTYIWISYLKPPVKGIVEKQISKKGTYYPSLWRSFSFPTAFVPFPVFNGCLKPSCYVHLRPFFLHMSFNRFLQKFIRHIVKETGYVHIDNPMVASHVLSNLFHCLMSVL